MVGSNVKAETLALMDQRVAMETEMNNIIQRLSASAGVVGNLVDNEGFPRADIDVTAVRTDRHRLDVLRNDHKGITARIEQNIHILHSGAFPKDPSSLPQKRTADGEEVRRSSNSVVAAENEAIAMEVENRRPSTKIPFAVFDDISENSPSAIDGLMVGDQLIKFGDVEGGDNLLGRLAREGQMNNGRPIQVVILRRGVEMNLTVTPRQWTGRGLLGCHIQPL